MLIQPPSIFCNQAAVCIVLTILCSSDVQVLESRKTVTAVSRDLDVALPSVRHQTLYAEWVRRDIEGLGHVVLMPGDLL